MSVQDTYSENMGAARAGMIADTGSKALISRNIEVGAVGFGVPVAQGANDKGAHKAKAGDTAILGITVRERSTVNDEFAIGDSARVLTEGAIWVPVSVDVSAGDPVHVDLASAGFTRSGGVAIAGARFDTSAASGKLAVARLK